MYIFAWILFSLFVISFTFRIAIVVGRIIHINETGEGYLNINLSRFIIDIAAFVFICLYLFMR